MSGTTNKCRFVVQRGVKREKFQLRVEFFQLWWNGHVDEGSRMINYPVTVRPVLDEVERTSFVDNRLNQIHDVHNIGQ